MRIVGKKIGKKVVFISPKFLNYKNEKERKKKQPERRRKKKRKRKKWLEGDN